MRLGAPLSRWPATARANVEHVDEMHPGLIDQTADAAYHKVHEYLSREFPGLAAAARQALSIASADLARHLTLALCAGPFGLVDRCKPHRLVDATCVLEGYASELPLPIVEAAFKTFGYLGLGGDFTPAQLVIGDCMSASKYLHLDSQLALTILKQDQGYCGACSLVLILPCGAQINCREAANGQTRLSMSDVPAALEKEYISLDLERGVSLLDAPFTFEYISLASGHHRWVPHQLFALTTHCDQFAELGRFDC